MSQRVATLEAVRSAYHQLKVDGRPSADKITKLVGGSKNTVLEFMKTVIAEETGASAIEVPQQLLESAAVAMAQKLWSEAHKIAEATSGDRIVRYQRIQETLLDDLTRAVEAEVAQEMRAVAAEARVVELQAELDRRASADDQLSSLMKVLSKPKAGDLLPHKFLLLLLDGHESRDRQVVLDRMKTLGFSPGQINSARYHASDYKYIEERVDGSAAKVLRLTAKGKQHLLDQST